jgi:CHAT domain-containing protein
LIYTFVQADQLDVILVSAGQAPVHQRIPAASRAALTRTIAAATQGDAAADRQLYDWLITPFATELQAQSIATIVFSIDPAMAGFPLTQLANRQQSGSPQYQIRQVAN